MFILQHLTSPINQDVLILPFLDRVVSTDYFLLHNITFQQRRCEIYASELDKEKKTYKVSRCRLSCPLARIKDLEKALVQGIGLEPGTSHIRAKSRGIRMQPVRITCPIPLCETLGVPDSPSFRLSGRAATLVEVKRGPK